MFPGDIIKLTTRDRKEYQIQIGETGSYHLDNIELNIRTISFIPRYQIVQELSEDEILGFDASKYYVCINGKYVHLTQDAEYDPMQFYYIISNSELNGLLTYSYSVDKDNSFAHVQTVSYNDSIFKQFIGEHDILHDIQYVNSTTLNVKQELMNISYIRATKRPIDQIVSEYINTETLEDNGEYYFGAKNNSAENRSERTPKIELMYPVGLRAYEPDKYYIYSNGTYTLDTVGYWQPGVTYYLKGNYRPTEYPVGQVAWVKTTII